VEALQKSLIRKLSYSISAPALFPPYSGILGTVQHLRQFFLNLSQAVGAHFHRRLVNLAVRGLQRRPLVHVAQIRDFLTKAGEMFQNIGHLLIIPDICRAAGF